MNEVYIFLYTILTSLADLFISVVCMGFDMSLEKSGSILAIAETVVGFTSLYVFYRHTGKIEICIVLVSVIVVNFATVAFIIDSVTVIFAKFILGYGTVFIFCDWGRSGKQCGETTVVTTVDSTVETTIGTAVDNTVENTVADHYILNPHIRHSFMGLLESEDSSSLMLGTHNKTVTMSPRDNGVFNLNLCENVNIKQHTVAYKDLIGFLNGYFLSFVDLPEASNRAIVCRKRIYQSIKKSYNMFSLSAITGNTFFLTHGALIIKVTVPSKAKGRYTVKCGSISKNVHKLKLVRTIYKMMQQSPFKLDLQEGQSKADPISSSSSSRSKSRQKKY